MALRFEVDRVLFLSPHCFSSIFPKRKEPMETRDARTYFFTLFFENAVGVNWIEPAEGADGGGTRNGGQTRFHSTTVPYGTGWGFPLPQPLWKLTT